MDDCATSRMRFETPAKLALEAAFDGGRLTSDGGLTWLAEVDKELEVCQAMAEHIPEWRTISDPLIGELPAFLQETAFLDRLKGIVPGWKVPKLGSTAFANSVGLKADFFGDALLDNSTR